MLTKIFLHKKYTIIIIGSAVLLLVIIGLIAVLGRGASPSQVNPSEQIQPRNLTLSPDTPTEIPENYYNIPSPLPDTHVQSAPPTPVPQNGDIVLDGIAVKNFKESASRMTEDGTVVLNETSLFQIIYFESSREFSIVIKGQNFEEARSAAEQDFLSRLRLDKGNACRLYVQEYVPQFINNSEAGNVYPLSFCYDESYE